MTAVDFSEIHEPTIDGTRLAKRRSLLGEEPEALSRRLVDLSSEGWI